MPRVDVIICASDEWGAALDEMPYVETGPTGQPVLILTNIQVRSQPCAVQRMAGGWVQG